MVLKETEDKIEIEKQGANPQKDDDFDFGCLTIILCAIAFFTLIIGSSIYHWKNDVINKNKEEFYELATKILQSPIKRKREQILIAFNSQDRKTQGILFTYGFINTLEDYLIDLVNSDLENKKELVGFVDDLILAEKEIQPFSDLPDDQRRILSVLLKSIENSDKVSAKHGLTELTSILKIVNHNMYELDKQNFWSLIIGITGIVITLLTTVLQFYSKFRKKKKSLINKDRLCEERTTIYPDVGQARPRHII